MRRRLVPFQLVAPNEPLVPTRFRRRRPARPSSAERVGTALAGCLLLAGLAAAPGWVAEGEVRAGTASASFELPARVPLAGYSRRRGEPSEGTHDPVGVRALILQDGDIMVALVSGDLLIVDERLFEAVRARLRASGFSSEPALLLAATHTHSGPGAYGTRFLEKLSMGHFDPAVFEALVRATAGAVARAAQDLAPVRVAYGAAATEGLVVNRVESGGPVDSELVAVGFYREGAEAPMAVVTNFAAHPTTLGAWHRRLSAEYPGVIADELARRFPGVTSLFFAGAVADQGPVKSGEGFERATFLGRPLAERAAAVLQAVSPARPDRVRLLQEQMPLPPASVRVGRWTFPRWLGQALVDDDATLSVARVGEVVFLGVPCDLASTFGARLKAHARARGLRPVVVGFANDYIGYCVPEDLYASDAYESSLAFNGPQTGELIVQKLTEMIDELGER